MSTEEKLEFSAQDLGRLARDGVATLDAVVTWLRDRAAYEDYRRVRDAVLEGFDEEEE